MNLSSTYPSVPSFPQSSILLKRGEGRDSTPTETALGAFQIAAAQLQEVPGAPLYRTYAVGIRFLRDGERWTELV
jgi:hypothetical protein